jgi:hypothetical protein
MSDPFIRTATAADAERCLAVLTLALGCDPPCRWAWPDPQQYLEPFPWTSFIRRKLIGIYRSSESIRRTRERESAQLCEPHF